MDDFFGRNRDLKLLLKFKTDSDTCPFWAVLDGETTMSQKPLVLKVSEVSKLLRIQRAKVYVLIDEGCLDAYKVGGDWRIRLDSVERLIGELPASLFATKLAA